MRKLLIFTALIFITSQSNAQVGYLGKRFTLTAGTSIAPPVLNFMFDGNNPQRSNNITVFSKWALLPPEIRLGADAVLSERWQFSLNTSWRGLQNTGFNSYESEYQANGTHFYVDSFEMKTNALDLSGSFKFYYEYAPIGKYFEIGGGITRVTSDVYPTYSYQFTDNSGFTNITSDKWAPGVYTDNIFHVKAAFGRTRILTRELIIDYGVRGKYFFGTTTFGPDPFSSNTLDFDYQEHFPDIIKYIQNTNLQSSYALEIYINFGLCL